ncbi:uncharacterized protein UHO2_00412 [Ustilago hordei]|uniref:uncharacterized protein n=1 Tax=Ustilago hordei TaxID=120017 RepID=UPI001A47A897|nr:uncharacterized protein UHO2_00412 [Ustilago hordei]SYW81915.1 uncharacterized protein UHO2_00412 [Ustilago hordei]
MVNTSPRKRVAKAQLQTDRDQKEHEIQEALSAFQKGQFKKLKATAEHHNVPYNTLWDHSKGHKSCTAVFQHLQAIPPEAKELLVLHIQKQAHYGFPITPQNLRQLAKQLLRQRTDNNDATLGPNWVSAFKQQHPELRSYYSHKMDAARVQATSDPSVVEAYFDVLKKTIAKYGILPENLFNMDETGFLIGQSQCQYIIVPRENGKNQCFRSQPGNWETITVIECIGAQGTKPPPMVIFQGKKHMQGWYHNHTAAKDWVFATSQNGWTNNELALHWLKDCLDKHTKQRAQGKYQLLILDGHGSHITAEFIQQAWDSHIIFLFLPPLATQLLQLLDVMIFGPLQQAFTKEVDKFAGANLSISKKDFINMYCKSQQVITSTLASQAFREVGINSKLHPDKVLSWDRMRRKQEEQQPYEEECVMGPEAQKVERTEVI